MDGNGHTTSREAIPIGPMNLGGDDIYLLKLKIANQREQLRSLSRAVARRTESLRSMRAFMGHVFNLTPQEIVLVEHKLRLLLVEIGNAKAQSQSQAQSQLASGIGNGHSPCEAAQRFFLTRAITDPRLIDGEMLQRLSSERAFAIGPYTSHGGQVYGLLKGGAGVYCDA